MWADLIEVGGLAENQLEKSVVSGELLDHIIADF